MLYNARRPNEDTDVISTQMNYNRHRMCTHTHTAHRETLVHSFDFGSTHCTSELQHYSTHNWFTIKTSTTINSSYVPSHIYRPTPYALTFFALSRSFFALNAASSASGVERVRLRGDLEEISAAFFLTVPFARRAASSSDTPMLKQCVTARRNFRGIVGERYIGMVKCLKVLVSSLVYKLSCSLTTAHRKIS